LISFRKNPGVRTFGQEIFGRDKIWIVLADYEWPKIFPEGTVVGFILQEKK